MKCPRCQHENEAGAKFCEECAAPLVRTCGHCGRQLSPTAKFCPECAHPTGSTPGTPTAPRFTSPERHTPKHLAERILNSKAALEGERKQVTVLFADMKGSMELLADRDPEEARKLLDPVLERMMEAVHRYEGTVNQVMGDGIMALFGAPVAHEDHAVRACYAALRMQESVKRYAEEIRRREGTLVHIRVGLNSGEVVVRSIGSDLHMDYTAVGQTTHLAARMEQLAMPGSILMSADTLRLAEGFVEAKPLGAVNVKGLSEPVETFEVTGAGSVRTRLQAATRRGLTCFVGRDVEVEQLRRAQELAGNGHGQIAAIVGEAGVGKSRLVYEFTHSHRLHGWLVLESASVSYGKATSYLPVIDVLKNYFKIQDRDDLRAIREKVTGKLLTLDEALKPTLPAFLALLDVPDDDADWQALDPFLRRQRTLEAIKRLLSRESRVQPVLLVFEDLHWIDSETQAFLDGLAESLPTIRMLLLVNYRPEYLHGWSRKTYYRQLQLAPLPAESAEALLSALLGDHSTLEPLKRVLVARTEGNPFFLEESVRTLIETKVLTGERGAHHIERPVETIQVPATVQAILAARLDRLPPAEKTLLQTAAVIGKDIPLTLLQAIVDTNEDALLRGLMHLQAAEFLYETSLFPEPEYTFKHALTYEVAYGSLLHERRRALHARIIDVIETMHRDRLPEHVEQLGHHAFRGEVWSKAATYLRQAGVKAGGRSAHRETIASLEQARVALTHLPKTREHLEQMLDVLLGLRNPLSGLGQLDLMNDRLREAELLAQDLGDDDRLGLVLAYTAESHRIAGAPTRALELCERARALATRHENLQLGIVGACYLGWILHDLGDYRGAVAVLTRNVQVIDENGLTYDRLGQQSPRSVSSRLFLIPSLAELGEHAEALASGQEALRIAEAIDGPWALVHANTALGIAYLSKGDLDRAIPALGRGIDVAERFGMRGHRGYARGHLAAVHVLTGRVAEGAALLEEVIEQNASLGSWGRQPRFMAYLSEARLRENRIAEAAELAGRALDLARYHEQRGTEAWVRRLLGEIASQREPPDIEDGEGHYRQAMTLADELGMRPLVAHCHLGLAKLSRNTGKCEQARAHLIAAIGMYREMEMTYWREQAEAVMTELV